ncbi:hypothetical protein D3C72_1716970 [compost metagenome]
MACARFLLHSVIRVGSSPQESSMPPSASRIRGPTIPTVGSSSRAAFIIAKFSAVMAASGLSSRISPVPKWAAPKLQAAPKPKLRPGVRRSAPRRETRSRVSSLEPLSTTTTLKPSGNKERHWSIVVAEFQVTITTPRSVIAMASPFSYLSYATGARGERPSGDATRGSEGPAFAHFVR